TAVSIADAYARFIFPKCNEKQLTQLQIVLGGGGAKNPTLRLLLSKELSRHGIKPGQLCTHENFGIANEAKEALAFAILAYETLQGQPSNVPSATGAKRPVILGKIVPGDGFRKPGAGRL